MIKDIKWMTDMQQQLIVRKEEQERKEREYKEKQDKIKQEKEERRLKEEEKKLKQTAMYILSNAVSDSTRGVMKAGLDSSDPRLAYKSLVCWWTIILSTRRKGRVQER